MTARVFRVAVAVALTVALTAAAGCPSADDEFCAALSERYQMSELVVAIGSRDEHGIKVGLSDLRELQRTAPASLHDDVRLVLDTLTEVIAASAKIEDLDGADHPIDLTSLNNRLATIEPASQRIVRYADMNCGVTLQP